MTQTENPLKVSSGDGQVGVRIPLAYELLEVRRAWSDGCNRIEDFTAPLDVGLTGLGLVVDPLGTIISIALDSLKEFILANCKPLADILDALLGAPDRISERSRQWSDLAADYAGQRIDHDTTSRDLKSWKGEAALNYGKATMATDGVYEAAEDAAARLSKIIAATGALVGIFREFLWQLFKSFISEIIKAALLALASAIPTMGGSIGAFAAWASARFAMIGSKFATGLAKLMAKCGKIARKLGFSGQGFDKAARALTRAASKLKTAGSKAPKNFDPKGFGTRPGPLKDGYDAVKEVTKPTKTAKGGLDGMADDSEYGDQQRAEAEGQLPELNHDNSQPETGPGGSTSPSPTPPPSTPPPSPTPPPSTPPPSTNPPSGGPGGPGPAEPAPQPGPPPPPSGGGGGAPAPAPAPAPTPPPTGDTAPTPPPTGDTAPTPPPTGDTAPTPPPPETSDPGDLRPADPAPTDPAPTDPTAPEDPTDEPEDPTDEPEDPTDEYEYPDIDIDIEVNEDGEVIGITVDSDSPVNVDVDIESPGGEAPGGAELPGDVEAPIGMPEVETPGSPVMMPDVELPHTPTPMPTIEDATDGSSGDGWASITQPDLPANGRLLGEHRA